MKIKASSPVEALREQVRERALNDARFSKQSNGQPGSVWVCDLIPPEGEAAWAAIISASDAKLYQVPFTIQAGVVTLGETSQEVFRSIRYLPLAANNAPVSGSPVIIRAQQFTTEVSVDRWMFAPGGVHTITPAAGEGSAEITLRIDESTAAVLNASLARLNEKNNPQRAYFDKEHDEAAGATAWPVKFVWAENPVPGIYCECEPSEMGRKMIEGRVIRAFSPSFYSDAALPKKVARNQHVQITAGKRGSKENPARMTGIVFPACGTLTNNPAFRKILPLWAKNAPGAHPDNQIK